jgi:CO/xanthine dehydrogenase FAD-binding subunit
VAASIAPEDDARIPAAYRRELTMTLVRRAVAAALAREAAGQRNG